MKIQTIEIQIADGKEIKATGHITYIFSVGLMAALILFVYGKYFHKHISNHVRKITRRKTKK